MAYDFLLASQKPPSEDQEVRMRRFLSAPAVIVVAPEPAGTNVSVAWQTRGTSRVFLHCRWSRGHSGGR
jgi:hypothetical protein